MQSLPYYAPLIVKKGANFQQDWVWLDEDGNPVDLTGYSARQVIYFSDGSTLETTSTAGDIVIADSAGRISSRISWEDTETMTGTRAGYDLFLENSGLDLKVWFGTGPLKLVPEVPNIG